MEIKGVEMETNYNTRDALGNEIIIGGAYGYSNSNNGILVVKLGTITGFTNTGTVSLSVRKSMSAYSNAPLTPSARSNNFICVKPGALFPISEMEIWP